MVKSRSAFWCPQEGVVLLCEFREWSSNVCVMWNEGSLISEDTKHTAYFLDCFEFPWPISDTVCFSWVNGEFVAVDNNTEVFDVLLFKDTL